jgi:fatty-acyl-CoA synthase
MTFRFDWIEAWARYSPDKVAIRECESGRTLSYSQYNNVANRISEKLTKEIGLSKGDRVAILAENCLEYFILFSVAQKTGVTLVPLNYRLVVPEIDYLLRDSKPSLLIVQDKYKAKSDACGSRVEINHELTLEEMADDCDAHLNDYCAFKTDTAIEETDPLFILYTAGTTGFPKGALYTHRMLFWNSVNTTMRLNITSDDRSVSCTPLFHTGGWNVIPTPFLHRGASFCLTRAFDPDAILRVMEEEKSTMFMAVPTMLQMMVDSDLFLQVQLKQMRFFIIGGEPMPLPLIRQWHDKGVPIRQGYGMTEAGPSITSLHQDDAIRKMGSIGLPNFYIDTKIVDEAGNEVDANQVGELLLKGPSVTTGYWQNDTVTRESIVDGWLHTGDLVIKDDEGFLFVVDRMKNMYISGGENVYPAEVEKALHSHEKIAEAAVIGVPDEKWGEVGSAFIVLRKGDQLSEEALKDFCTARLAKFKIPKHFQFVDALPRTDAGKLDRKTMKELIHHESHQ